MAKPVAYSTRVLTEGEFAGKTLAPGHSNSMTDDEVAKWKVAMGFDAPPPPSPEFRPVPCGFCNKTPCECTKIWHEHDEAGTYLTPTGLLIQLNEAGYNSTTIDVRELVAWLRENHTSLLLEDLEKPARGRTR